MTPEIADSVPAVKQPERPKVNLWMGATYRGHHQRWRSAFKRSFKPPKPGGSQNVKHGFLNPSRHVQGCSVKRERAKPWVAHH